MTNTLRILVLCTGNSCRSQMAEGFLRHFGGPRVEVYSAGVVTHGLNPRAVAVMKADGVDISRHTSNHVDEYRDIAFDHVITVCDSARESCPWLPTAAAQHHRDFADPANVAGTEEGIMAAFRETRDAIKGYCQQFIDEHT